VVEGQDLKQVQRGAQTVTAFGYGTQCSLPSILPREFWERSNEFSNLLSGWHGAVIAPVSGYPLSESHRRTNLREEAMAKIEHIREVLSRPFDEGHFRTKLKEGWKLVALEWQREVEGDAPRQALWIEEVPYGLRVADDCLHLQENPVERRTLELMLRLISSDKSMSQIAEELNRQGLHTRQGTAWSKTAVFDMLPRLIEAAPQIWRSSSTQASTL
jgi:Recombinase